MLALVLAAATPAPSPSPARQLDVTTVTPGITGFAVTFGLVIVAIGIFLLMSRSLRRTAFNARKAGMEVSEPARVGRGITLPVRGPEPTVPGVLDGGSPFEVRGEALTPDDDVPPGAGPGARGDEPR